jgi:hypothetical protein
MTQLEHFEVHGRRATHRPTGAVSLDEAIAIVDAGLRLARQLELRQVLVDTTQMTGFPVPRLVERYVMATQWAETASAAMTVAFLALPKMVDPGHFGVVVARNRGLWCEVFVSEQDALTWLDAQT